MSNKKIYLFAFIVLIIIAIMVYFLWKQKYPSIPTPPTTPSIVDTSSSTAIRLPFDPMLKNPEVLSFPNNNLDTSDWQTYRNEQLGFEVKYPNGWKVGTRPATNGTPQFIEFFRIDESGKSMSVALFLIEKGKLNTEAVQRGDETTENRLSNNIEMTIIHFPKDSNWSFNQSWHFEHKGFVYHFAETFGTISKDVPYLNAIIRSFKFTTQD